MEEVKSMEKVGAEWQIALSGEIDFAKAEEFYQLVVNCLEKDPVDVCFDCENLEFIDSTTLGTFVKILKKVKTSGNKMRLVHLQPKIKKLFVICALDSIIDIE